MFMRIASRQIHIGDMSECCGRRAEKENHGARLCSFLSDAVDNADAFDELLDLFSTVEAAPAFFAFPPELKHECERGETAPATFRLFGPVTDSGER